jgi:hypothetical protein
MEFIYSSSKLRPIEEFVLAQKKHNPVVRTIMNKVDAGKVVEYRERLMQALAEFGVSVDTEYLPFEVANGNPSVFFSSFDQTSMSKAELRKSISA